MPELNDASIPSALAADITDDDLVLVYDNGAASNKSRKATRGNFLHDVVRTGADVTLGDVEADSLSAPAGTINTLAVPTGLIIGATLSKILVASASLAVSTLAAGASVDITLSVTGAVTGDLAIVNAQSALPAGLLLRAYVSAANTVTITVTNASTGSINGASYTFKGAVLRLA